MSRLILLIAFIVAATFGYNYYRSSHSTLTFPSPTSRLTITSPSDLGQIANVLGTSIYSAVNSGRELLNEATAGQSDPLINRALTNLQNEVKDLPQETVAKVKYEFCKDVVTEYENR